MKYPNLLVGFIILFFGLTNCTTKEQQQKSSYDSLKETLAVDSIKESLLKNIYTDMEANDLATIQYCPVIILNSAIKKNSIGIPEAYITIRNNSDKRIDGIKMGMYLYNNFDEPVKDNITDINFTGGISQDILRIQKSDTYVWTLYRFESATKVKPFVREIHFTDSTTWNYLNFKK